MTPLFLNIGILVKGEKVTLCFKHCKPFKRLVVRTTVAFTSTDSLEGGSVFSVPDKYYLTPVKFVLKC